MTTRLRNKLRLPISRFLDRHAGLVAVIRRHLLTLLSLAAVVVGVGSGLILRSVSGGAWSVDSAAYVAFPGEIYLRLLNCLILPLVSSSLISSLGSLELGMSGRLAFHAALYFLVTTPCAIALGIVLVTTIHPGMDANDVEDSRVAPIAISRTSLDTFLDLFRNIFPDNIVASCFSQYVTVRVPANSDNHQTSLDISTSFEVVRNNRSAVVDAGSYEARESRTQGVNVLGLVMFCILLGVSVGRLKDKGRPVAKFFTSLFESVMGVIRVIIWLSPISVLFLVCAEILHIHDFRNIVDQVGLYCATVLTGLAMHGFLVIPTVFFVVTRTSPYRFLWNQVEALATAFASASSAAAMPVSIRCLEDNNGVHPKVSRFVMPIGIINMQGTALYEAVAVLFIAQVHGVHLNIGNVIVVSVTAAAASMGSAGIPQAGLVTMLTVLNSVGLSAKHVSLIVVVDWIIDRFRTLVNVVCDSVAAGIVNHFSKAELESWEFLATFRNETPPLVRPPDPCSSNDDRSVYVDILALV